MQESLPVCNRTGSLTLFDADPSLGLGWHLCRRESSNLRSPSLACPQATWRGRPGKCLPTPQAGLLSAWTTCQNSLSGASADSMWADGHWAKPCDSLGSTVRHISRGDSWKPTPAHSKVQIGALGSGLTDFVGEHLGPSWDKCFLFFLNKCIFKSG